MTTIVLPEQQRQGTCTYASLQTPAGITWARADAIIPAADLTNPANSLLVSIEQSFDDGLTWRGAVLVTWQGGPGAVLPSCTTFFETPRRLRVTVDVPNRMRLGATMTHDD